MPTRLWRKIRAAGARLWHWIQDLSEPGIVFLIRLCGWSAIVFVFGIFVFILIEGAPFLVNKLRFETREVSVADRAGEQSVLLNVAFPGRHLEIPRFLSLATKAGLDGIAELWLAPRTEEGTERRALLDLEPGADAARTVSALASWLDERMREDAKKEGQEEDPQLLRVELAEARAAPRERTMVLSVPFHKPDATAATLRKGEEEGRIQGIPQLWSSLSRESEGRVLVELEAGVQAPGVLEKLPAVMATRAVVLSELPVENPEEFTYEQIHEALLEEKLDGVRHVRLEPLGGHVHVVLELEESADGEAVANRLLEAVPMRQDYSHLGPFVTSTQWIPDSESRPQFGIFALIVGTLSVTALALLLSVPVGLGAAIYVSEFCKGRLRESLKITIELLAAIPSVVWGFIGYVVMNPLIIWATGAPIGINVLNGGIILALMSIPIIVSVGEDALKAVPDSYREAAIALGASRWQVTYKVLLPAAKNGLLAAALLGVGRSIGETMAVLMATGHSVQIPHSFLDPVRTLTATIAAELGEAAEGEGHYTALFVIGMVLMGMAFVVNLTADLVVRGIRGKQNA